VLVLEGQLPPHLIQLKLMLGVNVLDGVTRRTWPTPLPHRWRYREPQFDAQWRGISDDRGFLFDRKTWYFSVK